MDSRKHIRSLVYRLLLAAMLVAPLFAVGAGAASAAGPAGVVYTLSNEADGNDILVYQRAEDGTLSYETAFPTGGLGSGSGLGSQGSLVLSQNGRFLFAVNAGSNDISVFRVTPGGLALLQVTPSGGEMPISLTSSGRLLYVLNAGGAGNIAGFRLSVREGLEPIEGSIRPLSNGGSGAGVGPAQVEFDPDGKLLVVTEKMTNLIDVYAVDGDGRAQAPQVFPSSGATPFGFAFTKRGHLVVSEAFGGAPGASALSSYDVSVGALAVISPSVPTQQTAACWVVITDRGQYAYTTNTGSNSISSYRLERNGALTLLEPAAGETGAGPIDMALSQNSRYLYSLDSGSDTISAFRVGEDGSLEKIDFVEGLPASSVGLAAR